MKKIIIAIVMFVYGYVTGQNVYLKNEFYNNCYDLKEKISNYTVYEYSTAHTITTVKRNSIKLNPEIKKINQLGYKDYRKLKTYDKGHLVPSSHFQYSLHAQKNVNYYTNVVPQWFTVNRGIWKNLEEFTEKLYLEKRKKIIIYTGTSREKININGVKIPTYLYKLIIQEKNIYAFIIPNKETIITDFMRYRVNPTEIVELIESYNQEKIKLE